MPDFCHVSLHAESWPLDMRADLLAARIAIHLSALSLLTPTPPTRGPWRALWSALKHAPARNITTTIYLPVPQPAHPATRQNATSAATCHAHGMKIVWIPAPRLLHAKSCIIDSQIAWLGSGNMTAAACHHNRELYLRVHSHAIAAETINTLRAFADPSHP